MTSTAKRQHKHLLLDFPNIKMIAVLITDWLTIWDLGRLDSSICNHKDKLREKYLQLFSSNVILKMNSTGQNINNMLQSKKFHDIFKINHTPSHIIHSIDIFKFLLKYNIALTTIAFTIFIEKNMLEEYFLQFGNKLIIIEFYGHYHNKDSWNLYYNLFNLLPNLNIILFHKNSCILYTQDFIEITEKCSNLKILYLHNKFHLIPPNKTIKPYLRPQPPLTIQNNLNIQLFSLYNYTKTLNNCIQSLYNNINLTELDLTGCTSFNDNCLLQLIPIKYKLNKLNLNYCTKLTSTGIISFFTSTSNVKTSIFDLRVSKLEITTEIILLLSQYCPDLLYLDISNCKYYSSISINTLFEKCLNIETIVLSNNIQITDENIEILLYYCKNIHSIYIHNCSSLTDICMNSLLLYIHQLKAIHIGGRSNITHMGLINSVENTTNSSHGINDSTNTTMGLINSIENRYLQLTDLDISDQPNFHNDSIITILNTFPNVRILNISGIKNITITTINSITTKLKYLEELKINEIFCLIDSVFSYNNDTIQCGNNILSSLYLLSMNECEYLSDTAIIELVQGCGKGLISLSLNNCIELTDIAGMYSVLDVVCV